MAVAGAMLDEEHPTLPAVDSNDNNIYKLGRMSDHNVVIACLPDSKTGTVSAAVVATDLLRTFKKVKIGLMVGIGGGAPYYQDATTNKTDGTDSDDEDLDTRDIRLGDVAISLGSKFTHAVVQYDFGKSIGGEFVRTSTLNDPPRILLSAISALKAEHRREENRLPDHIATMVKKYPKMMDEFVYPGVFKDQLFKPNVLHAGGKKSCRACCGPSSENLIERESRIGTSPVLHYGTIGSANQVMKDALLRDKWASKEGIICFEMEAAGVFLFRIT